MRLASRKRCVVVLSLSGFATSARVRLVVDERRVVRFGTAVRDSFNRRQPCRDRTRSGGRLHRRNALNCHPEGQDQVGKSGARTI
jgi:hypothetical protein